MYTFFHGCGIPPVTLQCGTQGAQAQAFPTLGSICQATTGILTRVIGCAAPQAQAQTIFPTIPPVCFPTQTATTTVQGGGAAQAQTIPTLGVVCGTIGITTGIATKVFSCGGAQAQAQTGPPITNPQDCGISWNCNAAQAQAFPTLGSICQATTGILTKVIGCGAQAQAQTLSAPPHCPTVSPPCTIVGPTGYQGCGQTAATVCTQTGGNAGAAAQAQVPTVPVFQCASAHCTGIVFVC